MKNKVILLIVAVLFSLIATPALAARTVPGEVPILEPLQPAPENTKPNISSNIYNGTPLAPGEESASASSSDSPQNSNSALKEVQQTLPLPIPESQNSALAWILTALIIILAGAGIGYWAHIRNK